MRLVGWDEASAVGWSQASGVGEWWGGMNGGVG